MCGRMPNRNNRTRSLFQRTNQRNDRGSSGRLKRAKLLVWLSALYNWILAPVYRRIPVFKVFRKLGGNLAIKFGGIASEIKTSSRFVKQILLCRFVRFGFPSFEIVLTRRKVLG